MGITSYLNNMTIELLLRYLHFISIFAIVGALVSEHMLLQKQMTRATISKVAMIDAVYGVAALLLLGAGLTLWLGSFGKPAIVYSKNWIFHTKLTLFLIVGLLSIYPTVFFLKNRKGNGDEIVHVPKIIFVLVRFEILILFIIPILAGLMSRGVGLL
jgi:putative membrane protein